MENLILLPISNDPVNIRQIQSMKARLFAHRVKQEMIISNNLWKPV